jgi:hypothetical protein
LTREGMLDISTQFVSMVRYVYKKIPLDPAIFSSESKISILLYVVSKFMQKISRFYGKTGRYYDLKIKFVDISHHRYKLRRDIEL